MAAERDVLFFGLIETSTFRRLTATKFEWGWPEKYVRVPESFVRRHRLPFRETESWPFTAKQENASSRTQGR